MTNAKNTKRALLSSVLALFLCFAMLLGTTYAWFTDSVTSDGNIIKSGTLDIEMYWAKGTEDPASADWKDASTTAIFDYDNWEPGYTDAKHIKIANEGTLDLQWQLAIVPNGSISKLAEVIDVYYVSSATTVATRDDVDNAWYVGSLASVINGGIAAGDLTVADKEYTATIVLKMQETAGNEYQNLSIGDSFSVKLFATQLDSEEDSFGKDYDADIVWDGTIPTAKPDSLVVDTTAKVISINDIQAFAYLNTLVNDANFVDNYGSKWQYTIELNTDIDLFNRAWTPIVLKNFVAFEGNGHTISNLRVSTTGDRAGLFGVVSCNDIGVTYVRNLTIDGAVVNGNKNVGVVVGSGTQAAVENVTVNNAIVGGVKYVGGIFGSGNGSVNGCTVKNSTITINQVVIDPEDNSIDSKEAGGLIGYLSNDGNATTVNKVIANNTVENVTITAPSVASGLVAQPNSSNSGGAVIEVKNNTMKNVTITTTKDATAALYVSNNVNGKTLIENNTADGCSLGNAISDADDLSSALTDSANTNIYIVLTGDVDMPISSLGQQTAGSGEYKLGGAETETITIDLNGYRLNVTTTYWSVLGAVNPDAVFTIKNGTMTSSQTSGTWNSYDLAFANCNYVIEDVVFDKAVAFDNAGKSVTMKNVTINETHDYYALWITAEGQTVEIDGLTINSAGRGIKIDEQYVGTPAKVTLKVTNATFDTNKKAAIMVKSVAGADITMGANVNITNVAADSTNAVWVDSDAADYADKVTVTGGTVITES